MNSDEVGTARSSSRRNFLKIGAGVLAAGAVAGVVAEAPLGRLVGTAAGQTSSSSASSSSTTSSGTISTATGPATTSTVTGSTTIAIGSSSTTAATSAATTTNQQNVFLVLSTTQAAELAAIIGAIIPTDSNGPGGKEAGVIYFIDRQLASDYGKNGNMYGKGPFVMPGQKGPITVDGITYTAGSMIANPTDGTKYQYGMLFRDFWRYGLEAFETYCNGTYGGDFEALPATAQVKALTDLANNTPTSFNDIVPSDFFHEVFFMTWCGFLMDPLYGGNQGMVGWELVGFNGTNQGNFYGEGYTTMQLMVATTPTRLRPASLAQFQQAAGAST